MAWTSRQIYDVTRIMIYALVGIFLICALVAAVPGARWYELYEMATIIAQLVMFAGAIVAPIAAIAGAHVYYTGQRGRKQKEHDHDLVERGNEGEKRACDDGRADGRA